MNYVAGGAGKAILFVGNQLWAVADTLSDSTFNFSITADDIRGGKKNTLLAQYFHDPNLGINLTNALFNFDDIALMLGGTINPYGLDFMEEQLTAAAGGVLTATQTPVAVAGETIGWYRKPTETTWTVGTFTGNTMTIAGASATDVYCIKYFWNNENARSFEINAEYQPAEVHLVILQDLFSVERRSGAVAPGARAGVMITDIPRFQLNGSLDLDFSAGSNASTSLAGNALAINDEATCEDDFIFGTMTESIEGAVWQENVIAVAVADNEIELGTGESITLSVYAVFGNNMASQLKDNSNFTFTVDSGTSATVNTSGVVTADAATTGDTYISVTLTGYDNAAAGIVKVTVS